LTVFEEWKNKRLSTWSNGDRNLRDPDSLSGKRVDHDEGGEVSGWTAGSGYDPGDETKRRLRRGFVCPVWENITF
jgi:hypothetical protein